MTTKKKTAAVVDDTELNDVLVRIARLSEEVEANQEYFALADHDLEQLENAERDIGEGEQGLVKDLTRAAEEFDRTLEDDADPEEGK